MRQQIIAALSASKQISKARVSGKFSFVPITKLNLLNYYIIFAKEQIDLGIEEYKDKYQELVQRSNNLIFNCSEELCGIREDIDSTGEFTNTNTTISNPYNPIAPSTPPPEPPIENEPATIDDKSIEVNNNVTTTLTLAMFTSVYSDPEGDLIDAIRIDDIHSTNQGTFYVGGIEVVEGQIITREQLIADDFTHVGPDIQTIATDSFIFSARDEGSGIWVQ